MQLSKRQIIAIASGAILILGFLTFKSQSVSTKKHLRYSTAIAKQKEIDSQVNQSVLRARYELLSSYDIMVQAMKQQEELQTELASLPGYIANQGQLQNNLDKNAEAFEQKYQLLEQFKTQNAVLKNSLTYLPNLVQELRSNKTKLGLPNDVEQSLANVLDDALLYSLSSNESLTPKIKAGLQRIDQRIDNKSTNASDLKLVLNHVRVILENKPKIDRLTTELLNASTTESLANLDSNYQKQHQSARRTASNFQILAIGWLICMLGAGTIAYFVDRQQKLATRRTAGILSSITDAFFALNQKWQVTYINSQAADVFQLDQEAVIDQGFFDVLPEEIVQPIISTRKQSKGEQQSFTFDAFYQATEDWFEVRVYPSIDGYSIFLQKITDRKLSEKELLTLNQDLQEQSVELNQMMTVAEEEREKAKTAQYNAEEANRSKSEFLANMSHELRTPLNAIIGYSEMLAEDAEDCGQDDFIPDLNKIRGSGKHLLGLINSVLDLSKVEAGKMELYLETFEIEPMIQSIAATIHPLAEKNFNTLEINCSKEIGSLRTDQTKLRQSLLNLLSNACKFTPNGFVSLSVKTDEQLGGSIYFEVSDTGIGMTPEQLEKIFQAFTQADASTTRKYGGTGLGLTLTKEFVTLMGGEVTVESEVGHGTTFTIRLPHTVEASEAQAQSDTNTTGPTGPEASIVNPVAAAIGELSSTTDKGINILVIDDDPDAQAILNHSLSKEGYTVFSAGTGAEGLRIAAEVQPDIITLDVYLQDTNGWSILKALKADPQLADIPVIMISMLDSTQIGFALGAADFLTKPIERDSLLAVMEKYAAQKETESVLVVEDDEASRNMMCRLLTKENWTVQQAENGQQALNLLEQGNIPLLILLDLDMPEIDGFELLRKIRQSSLWKLIPVIIVTAKDLSSEDRHELGNAAQGIYQKGNIDHQLLLSEIEEFISLAKVP